MFGFKFSEVVFEIEHRLMLSNKDRQRRTSWFNYDVMIGEKVEAKLLFKLRIFSGIDNDVVEKVEI